eukprot:144522-Prorocentrum_minimum.AAC.1
MMTMMIMMTIMMTTMMMMKIMMIMMTMMMMIHPQSLVSMPPFLHGPARPHADDSAAVSSHRVVGCEVGELAKTASLRAPHPERSKAHARGAQLATRSDDPTVLTSGSGGGFGLGQALAQGLPWEAIGAGQVSTPELATYANLLATALR